MKAVEKMTSIASGTFVPDLGRHLAHNVCTRLGIDRYGSEKIFRLGFPPIVQVHLEAQDKHVCRQVLLVIPVNCTLFVVVRTCLLLVVGFICGLLVLRVYLCGRVSE
jgi:hypothetical protein